MSFQKIQGLHGVILKTSTKIAGLPAVSSGPVQPLTLTGAANPGSFPGMPSPILCLGAINLDLKFQVDDLEGFLKDWGTGLSRAGEEAVSREDEARLTALLARYGRPAGRFGGGMAANTAYALACLGLPVGLVGRVGADADGEFLQKLSLIHISEPTRRTPISYA